MRERDFDAALEAAARLLSASRFPVIAGLRTDIAGVVAGLRLAERLGGAADHAGSEGVLREAAVLHDAGLMLVSPGEARRLADTFLVVGDRPFAAWPDLPQFLFAKPSAPLSEGRPSKRRVLSLSNRRPALPQEHEVSWLECDAAAVPGLIGAIRARVNGRPIATEAVALDIPDIAERLRAAKFGVAIWSPDELDALTIEMLTGLVKELNADTRWSGISVVADISAAGAAIASGWVAGLPLRVGFGRGHPEHDPWRFEARRLVQSGEADAIVWVSTFGEAPPAWIGKTPAVFIRDGTPSEPANGDTIRVGRPGREHEAVLFDRRTGTLVRSPGHPASDAPSAADALNGILARLSTP